MTRYDEELLEALRRAYARNAAHRDDRDKPDWKLNERDIFLARLQAEDKRRLIDLGAGPGQDALFFSEHGLDVMAVDLTPEMVDRCIAKGLDARVMDFLHLDLPDASFDAAWAMSSLLHVPNADLPSVLESIERVLAPGALFFIGVYGGVSLEGPREWDELDPPRFFADRTDDELRGFLEPRFEIVDFRRVDLGVEGYYYQAVTVRARVDKWAPERVS